MDSKREMLRHTVATLAYRAGKTLRGAPDGFAEFRAFEQTRTPGEILAHMGDLLDWAVTQAEGREKWRNSEPMAWDDEVSRFFAALSTLDACLRSGEPLVAAEEKMFQGAIADALTHTGQLAMLRRLAGAPIKGENYSRAAIAAGRVGPAQSAPEWEFE